jgi:leader peptidase (prepilin peptidase)/N-methyltransferase
VQVVVGAFLGGLIGLVSDRLSARWPLHADGSVRGLDWRTIVVTLAAGASFAAVIGQWPDARDQVVLGVYVAALMVLLATDLDQRLLPDLVTLPLIGYSLVVLVTGLNPLLEGKDLALVSAIGAAIGAPALLLVTDRLFGGALGMGDVKLAVSLGAMCGVSRLVTGFLVASVVFAVVLLVLIALRRISLRQAIPFGPVLIAAGVIATVV